MGRGTLATSIGACGGHGTGGHASPAVRGAREGRIGVGVWRGRRCRAWLKEERRDGAGRKLELELEPAMAGSAFALGLRTRREASRGKGERLESGEVSRGALGVCYRGRRDATMQQGEALAAAHGWHVHATRPLLGHFPEHVAGNGLGTVEHDSGPDLGRIGPGPKRKFEAREMLYIFRLRAMVIRAMD
jgi:hypothetical protein